MLFRRKRKKRKREKETPRPRVFVIRQIVFGILLVLSIALVGTGVWYGTRVSTLTIDTVEVIGAETIDPEYLREIAEEELVGTYYKMVPRAFAWTYPRNDITARIGEIERIKNVHAERTSGRTLVIAFEEYHPFALWCMPSIDGGLAFDSACLFLDREGYAFSAAPKLDGGAFVRFSEVDRMPEVATQGFAGDFVRTTEAFIGRAYEQVGLNIIQVEKSGEEDVTYHISGGGQLKTTLRMTPEETIENLELVLGSNEFNHISPGNFQYIDLRYGNRIFVNEELQTTENTTTSTTTATTTITFE